MAVTDAVESWDEVDAAFERAAVACSRAAELRAIAREETAKAGRLTTRLHRYRDAARASRSERALAKLR